jgi:hypothetical protein
VFAANVAPAARIRPAQHESLTLGQQQHPLRPGVTTADSGDLDDGRRRDALGPDPRTIGQPDRSIYVHPSSFPQPVKDPLAGTSKQSSALASPSSAEDVIS